MESQAEVRFASSGISGIQPGRLEQHLAVLSILGGGSGSDASIPSFFFLVSEAWCRQRHILDSSLCTLVTPSVIEVVGMGLTPATASSVFQTHALWFSLLVRMRPGVAKGEHSDEATLEILALQL